MITDPDGDAWTSSAGYESGDLCDKAYGPRLGGSGPSAYDEVINGGHYYLQEEWSNATGSCQPRAKPDRASFAVARLQDRSHRLSLDASASDPQRRIVAYRWSFGDGSTGSGRRVSHRYPRAGWYAVTLRVTDGWGNWRFYTRRIQVR